MDFSWSYIGLSLVPLLAATGNIMVLICVGSQYKLRKLATNYFIGGLALSDTLVATLVMPFGIYMQITKGYWGLGHRACQAYLSLDVALSTTSILHLLLICLDRFVAVLQPRFYRRRWQHTSVVLCLSCAAWLISLGVSIPTMLKQYENESCDFYDPDFMIYSSIASFYVPATMFIVMYIIIYARLHQIAEARKRSQGKMKTYAVYHNDRAHTCTALPVEQIPLDAKLDYDRTVEEQDGSSIIVANETAVEDMDEEEEEARRPRLKKAYSLPNAQCAPGSIRREEHVTQKRSAWIMGYKSTVGLSRLSIRFRSEDGDSDDEDADSQTGFGKRRLTQGLRRLTQAIVMIRLRRSRSPSRKEQKAVKLVVAVLVCFISCWTPFFTFQLYRGLCLKKGAEKCHIDNDYSASVFGVTTWFGYLNSALNPVLYTMFNKAFRSGFRKILTCAMCRRRY